MREADARKVVGGQLESAGIVMGDGGVGCSTGLGNEYLGPRSAVEIQGTGSHGQGGRIAEADVAKHMVLAAAEVQIAVRTTATIRNRGEGVGEA